jgi:hypothetical protein
MLRALAVDGPNLSRVVGVSPAIIAAMAIKVTELESARALFSKSAGKVRVSYAFNPDRASNPPQDNSDGWVGRGDYATYEAISKLHNAGFTFVQLVATGTHQTHMVAISRLVASFHAANTTPPWTPPMRLPIEDAIQYKQVSDRTWYVYDSRYATGKNEHGRLLGQIQREDDGTYTPSGEYAMFGGKHEGCVDLQEATEVFIGFD